MIRLFDEEVGKDRMKTTIVNRNGRVPEYVKRGGLVYRLAEHSLNPTKIFGFVFRNVNYRLIDREDAPDIKYRPETQYVGDW